MINPSRRQFLATTAGATSAAMVLCGQPPAPAVAEDLTLALINGKIHTGDSRVVLDRDYFTVPDAEIGKIRSLLTIMDGKIVHDAGGL
jgi:hypothetical protein